MTRELVALNLQPGMTTHLTGYTSTSTKFECATKFALKSCGVPWSFSQIDSSASHRSTHSFIPVVLEIHFEATTGLFQLTREYTAYPGEDEYLIQDGLEYLVEGNREVEIEGIKYRVVRLRYPVARDGQ